VSRKFRPKTTPAHPYSVTPNCEAVSRYKTPSAGARRPLPGNVPHLDVTVGEHISRKGVHIVFERGFPIGWKMGRHKVIKLLKPDPNFYGTYS